MSGAALASSFARSFEADLVLYAGTNLHCPSGPTADLEQIGMMPVIGVGQEKQQPNVAALAQVEQIVAAQLGEIFHGRFAEARFQSCTQANLAVFIALLNPGDTVICLHADDGGHASQNGAGMLAHLAVKLLSIPFDTDAQCVDDVATADLVRRSCPRLVIFGPSIVVRPSDMARTAAACVEVGSVLVVDVSHVAGLIAGGAFPNPLEHGADLITASSYKTLGCPPAGFIVGRDNEFQCRIESAVSPKLLSNYDPARLLRFTMALEQSRDSFSAYAQAIIDNSAALRTSLVERGIPILTPTDGVFGTHQVVLLADDAVRIVSRLQESGVTTSLCGIPGRPNSSGVRLGTQLITRRGMRTEQMTPIAEIIASAIRSESHADVRERVVQLTADFPNLAFCAGPVVNTFIEGVPHGQ